MNDIIFKTEDLTYLSWDDKRSSSFGTQGCLLKTSEVIDNKRVYYKLSNYDSYRGVFGHECINELIASRVSDVLNNNHLKYDVFDDKVVNNYLYTKSTKENLKFIKKNKKICINSEKIDYIRDGLDKILPKEHVEKITTMITRRAEYYDEVYCKEL